MAISTIVPVLDEAQHLRPLLVSLRAAVPPMEIIVVDGGSTDGSLQIARASAHVVVESPAGRAAQMNRGAIEAHSDILWFVHADSIISESLGNAINLALENPQVVGGCFRLKLDSKRPTYRIRDAIGNALVAMHGMPLGDRGFFCRRDIFFEVGGYPEIDILEDAEFYRKMRRCGRVVQLRQTIGSSVRRYEALGPARTMMFYGLIMALYIVRVPISILTRLVHFYVGQRTRRTP